MSSEPEAGAQRALVDTPRKIEAADAKPSETEAELLCTDRKVPLSERVRPIQERMLSRPRTGLKADKAFFEELSGDILYKLRLTAAPGPPLLVRRTSYD